MVWRLSSRLNSDATRDKWRHLRTSASTCPGVTSTHLLTWPPMTILTSLCDVTCFSQGGAGPWRGLPGGEPLSDAFLKRDKKKQIKKVERQKFSRDHAIKGESRVCHQRQCLSTSRLIRNSCARLYGLRAQLLMDCLHVRSSCLRKIMTTNK